MEVVRTVGSVMRCIKMVVNLIDTNRRRGAEFAAGLDCVKEDLDLIKARLVKDNELHRQPLMELKLQELAYEIDDFVHGLWIPGPCGGIILSATALNPLPLHIVQIESFKGQAKTLREELDTRSQLMRSGSSAPRPVICLSSAGCSYAPAKELVGISKPKEEIVELLSPGDGQMRVISIVGRRGLGKTALARALYEDKDVVDKFDYKAWVVPSNNNSADILKNIRQEVEPASPFRSTSQALQNISNKIFQLLHLAPAAHFEKDKRYLVFVDDVQRGTAGWDIKDAFRENVMGSRIILTTSAPSVPRDRSSGNYVYTMQGLDKENSRELLQESFHQNAGSSAQYQYHLGHNDVDIIVDKCDGLPMALISAANCLRGKGQYPQREDFEQVSEDLSNFLACSESEVELYRGRAGNETEFVEMRRAFVEPYENLLNNGEKDCLLYVSIFPSGHQINSKSLARRLIAEGLCPGDHNIMKDSELVVGDVRECLRMLMDQQMLEPVPVRNYSNVAKRCRVHSIMLEFTIKKAVSRNLVSLIREDQPLHNTAGKVRRLTVQSSTLVGNTGLPEGMGLSFLRSLAIFNSGFVNFQECKLVRVLDLEGCRGLTQKDLDNICGLLYLKYLSLRNTDIQEVPKRVKKLLFLETLDIRETGVKKLPVEVIMLPRFAHLFGKIELTNVDKKSEKLKKFFSKKKSQLHTLDGIYVDEAQGSEIVVLVMQHATKLKKIKVWCKDTPSSAGPSRSTSVARNAPEPLPASTKLADTLLETFTDSSRKLDSVSIDFNGVSNKFLYFLKANGSISSIKLWKGSGSVPRKDNLGEVSNLKKLHLFSPGRTSGELGALQHLQCLQYLKLSEDRNDLWDSVFNVEVGGFRSLIWLCFEASGSNSKHPPLQIDKGVKTPLASLQLLCQGGPHRGPGEPLGVLGLSHLANLNEVILHKFAPDSAVEAWKKAAEGHINRPYVEKQRP